MDAFVITIHALAAISASAAWSFIGWAWYTGWEG